MKKRKRRPSGAHPVKRTILMATVEGLESLPSVWIEQKATGLVYGVKVYDPDPATAARRARELYTEIAKFAKEQTAGLTR